MHVCMFYLPLPRLYNLKRINYQVEYDMIHTLEHCVLSQNCMKLKIK